MTLPAQIPSISAGDVAAHSLKTLLIVAVIIVGFRLLGKRQAAQLNVYDLAMLMALSNAVQNAMTGGLGNLGIGLVCSSTIIVVAWGVTRLIVRRPAIEARVIGSPTILVSHGQVLKDRLRRERVTREELDAAIRQRGLPGVSLVELAVLEVDGSVSIVPKEQRMDHDH